MMSYLKRGWKFFEFFVRPLVVVGKYLEIFHLREGESAVLLKTNWEISQIYSSKDNLLSISEIADGERDLSCS